MFPVMLLDQLGASAGPQRGALPKIRAQIEGTRSDFLPEIYRMQFQLTDFDEHRDLRALMDVAHDAEHAHRRNFYRELDLRIKATGVGCQENGRKRMPILCYDFHRLPYGDTVCREYSGRAL